MSCDKVNWLREQLKDITDTWNRDTLTHSQYTAN